MYGRADRVRQDEVEVLRWLPHRGRRRIHDRAALLFAHMWERESRQSHRREEREIDGLLPGGVIEVVETAARGTAGVDDEDVECMERPQGVLNEHLTALPRREVSRDRQDVLVPSLPLDLLSHKIGRAHV